MTRHRLADGRVLYSETQRFISLFIRWLIDLFIDRSQRPMVAHAANQLWWPFLEASSAEASKQAIYPKLRCRSPVRRVYQQRPPKASWKLPLQLNAIQKRSRRRLVSVWSLDPANRCVGDSRTSPPYRDDGARVKYAPLLCVSECWVVERLVGSV